MWVALVVLNHTLFRVTGVELRQLEIYVEDSQVYFSSQYLTNTSGCIQEAVGNGKGRGVSPPRWCRKEAIRHIEKIIRYDQRVPHPLFNNNSLSAEPKHPTCNYSLRSVSLSSGDGMYENYGTSFDYVITVSIQQRNCSKQSWPARQGTSMRVELLTNRTYSVALPSCYLSHIERSEYIFKCLLNTKRYQAAAVGSSNCNAVCGVELVVTVDFERFNAFHELEGAKYGMGQVVIRKPIPQLSVPYIEPIVCCNAEAAIGAQPGSTLLPGVAGGTHSLPADSAAITNVLPQHLQSQVAHIQSMLNEYACVYFIGSSHLRYLWDTVAVNYFNGSSLLQGKAQHHSDEQIGNTWFLASHFSLEIPTLLGQICDPSLVYAPTPTAGSSSDNTKQQQQKKKKVAVVLETTSWDLDYLPARNLIQFKNSSQVVVEAVKAFASYDHTCAGYHTTVLWVNAVPIPECEKNNPIADTVQHKRGRYLHNNKPSCFDKGHRNNYAIRAVNEYFTKAFEEKALSEETPTDKKQTGPVVTVATALYDTMFRSNPHLKARPLKEGLLRDHAFTYAPNIRLVDAYGLVHPHRNINVCGLHYLCCKHAGKRPIEMQYTPGGVGVLNAILVAMQEAL